MKFPLTRIPSLGSLQTKGYWVALLVLLFGGAIAFLNFIFWVTMAVPVAGVFGRNPKKFWWTFAVVTLLAALGFLTFQCLQDGYSGFVFYTETGAFGSVFPQINFLSFLVVASIFLPLSAACAVSRIRSLKKR